ncbi:hypothetical protein I4F81_004355 [Pyropia yezoensis]|uniref:Uncharacterized protein n=1 Tax=Pyropia yezoensis TaxID=2788 RepID=A0ACC3BV47_PYRYE|nr:hypothetical protein I4F81_004355 [Neopyropia yezoensis]
MSAAAVGAFHKRLSQLCSSFTGGATFRGADVLLVVTGAVGEEEDAGYLKSYATFTWLLSVSQDVSEMALVVTLKGVTFVTTSAGAAALGGLLGSDNPDAAAHPHPPVVVRVPGAPKKGASSGSSTAAAEGSAAAATVLKGVLKDALAAVGKPAVAAGDAVAAAAAAKDAATGTADHRVVGLLTSEVKVHDGVFAKAAFAAVAGEATANAAEGLAMLLAVKDSMEQARLRKAARVTTAVFRLKVTPVLEDTLDKDKPLRHNAFADQIEGAILEPSSVRLPPGIRKENIDACYAPIVQSGGVYNLLPSAQSDNRKLAANCIIVSLGSRYAGYCANASRTFLVDFSADQRRNYETLLAAQEAVLAALTPGKMLKDAYAAAVGVLAKEGRELEARLGKNVGFGMGVEFRESALLLNARNEHVVRPGMVFNVSVGLSGLKDADKGTYALLVADTVVVPEGGPPSSSTPESILTSGIRKNFSDISYSLDPEEDEAAPGAALEEVKRRRHQAELEERLLKAGKARLAGAKSGDDSSDGEAGGRGGRSKKKGKTMDEFRAYTDSAAYPTALKPRQVFVDMARECVFVPISGVPVPFHVATIKNASKSDEGSHTYLRINFHLPSTAGTGGIGGAAVSASAASVPSFPVSNGEFVKELSFRSSNSVNLNDALRKIKELRKRVTVRETEAKEKESLVQQAALVVDRTSRVPTLSDVSLRPHLATGKANTGALEAHVNGFRYRSLRSGNVDVLYSNISNAFFQEADKEVIVCIHFHLRNAILVKGKKTKDVQVYTEVMESAVKLDDKRRRAFDHDELEEEQREREMKNRMNKAFLRFTRDAEERCAPLEFDMPYRDLGFTGAPRNESVLLMPTVSCIVDLIAWPPFVLNLEDVEVAHFERVSFQLRNFDLVFVFKDFETAPAKGSPPSWTRISTIPMTDLIGLKRYLDEQQIKFYEGSANINWDVTLKTIRADLEGFYSDGGYSDSEASDASGSEASGGRRKKGAAASNGRSGRASGTPARGRGSAAARTSAAGGAGAKGGSRAKSSRGKGGGGGSKSGRMKLSADDVRRELAGSSDEGEGELDSSEEGEDWEVLEERARADDRRKGRGDASDEDKGKDRRRGGKGGSAKAGSTRRESTIRSKPAPRGSGGTKRRR